MHYFAHAPVFQNSWLSGRLLRRERKVCEQTWKLAKIAAKVVAGMAAGALFPATAQEKMICNSAEQSQRLLQETHAHIAKIAPQVLSGGNVSSNPFVANNTKNSDILYQIGVIDWNTLPSPQDVDQHLPNILELVYGWTDAQYQQKITSINYRNDSEMEKLGLGDAQAAYDPFGATIEMRKKMDAVLSAREKALYAWSTFFHEAGHAYHLQWSKKHSFLSKLLEVQDMADEAILRLMLQDTLLLSCDQRNREKNQWFVDGVLTETYAIFSSMYSGLKISEIETDSKNTLPLGEYLALSTERFLSVLADSTYIKRQEVRLQLEAGATDAEKPIDTSNYVAATFFVFALLHAHEGDYESVQQYFIKTDSTQIAVFILQYLNDRGLKISEPTKQNGQKVLNFSLNPQKIVALMQEVPKMLQQKRPEEDFSQLSNMLAQLKDTGALHNLARDSLNELIAFYRSNTWECDLQKACGENPQLIYFLKKLFPVYTITARSRNVIGDVDADEILCTIRDIENNLSHEQYTMYQSIILDELVSILERVLSRNQERLTPEARTKISDALYQLYTKSLKFYIHTPDKTGQDRCIRARKIARIHYARMLQTSPQDIEQWFKENPLELEIFSELLTITRSALNENLYTAQNTETVNIDIAKSCYINAENNPIMDQYITLKYQQIVYAFVPQQKWNEARLALQEIAVLIEQVQVRDTPKRQKFWSEYQELRKVEHTLVLAWREAQLGNKKAAKRLYDLALDQEHDLDYQVLDTEFTRTIPSKNTAEKRSMQHVNCAQASWIQQMDPSFRFPQKTPLPLRKQIKNMKRHNR